MPILKFTPDRQPRREGDAMDAAMTVWAVLLNLIDWLTQNYVNQYKQGSSTVPAAGTFVDVPHSLGVALHRVFITPTLDPGARYWVSNKTATQFRINLSAVAPAGGIPFDWMVKGD